MLGLQRQESGGAAWYTGEIMVPFRAFPAAGRVQIS